MPEMLLLLLLGDLLLDLLLVLFGLLLGDLLLRLLLVLFFSSSRRLVRFLELDGTGGDLGLLK